MKLEKTWEELCEIARNNKYGFIYYTAESAIEKAIEVDNKPKNDDIEYKKEHFLKHVIREHMITDIFQVGYITIKLVGDEYTGKDYFTKEINTRGRFYMLRDDSTYPIDDYRYCTREEITELAQKHSDIIEKRSEDVSVVFPTGKLCISNYFCENRDGGFDDLPKDIKYDSEFSINHAIGREAMMKWLADNRGLAYGQLGNTCCSVWKISDDKLIVTSSDCYVIDDEGYEVELEIPNHWQRVGDICCDVWRFEVVDKQSLNDYGFDLEKYKKDNDYKEFGDVSVNPGEWEFKTYYQQRSNSELMEEFGYPIYAELNRKI